jgi:hypothetical protein
MFRGETRLSKSTAHWAGNDPNPLTEIAKNLNFNGAADVPQMLPEGQRLIFAAFFQVFIKL